MAIIFSIVFLILVGIAIKKYGDGKKHIGAIIYFFFVSNGFFLISDDVLAGLPVNKLIDFGSLYLLYVFSRFLSGKILLKRYFNQYHEMKLFMMLFIYLTANFLWTVISGQEFFGLSLATYRNVFRFLSFVLFVDMSQYQLKSVFKWILVVTTVACILFVIQPIFGIKTLAGAWIDISSSSSELSRYRNIPYSVYFFLVYATIRLNLTNTTRVLLFLLFGISLILTQHRGIMIGYAISIVAYLLIEKKYKKMVQYSIIGAFLFLTVGNMVVSRFEKANTGSDFEALLNLNYQKVSFEDDGDGGTLTFRIMHLLERADFLFNHPAYTLQGIGMRHEDSPLTQRDFNFYICSGKIVSNEWYNQEIDSGDLMWSTPLLRFGIIGLCLFLYITFYLFRFFVKNRQSGEIGKIAFYYYLLMIVTSFKNDQLFDPIHLFIIFMLYYVIKSHNIQLNLINQK